MGTTSTREDQLHLITPDGYGRVAFDKPRLSYEERPAFVNLNALKMERESSPQQAHTIFQVKVKKTSAALVSVKEIEKEKKIGKIVDFFIKNPHIGFENYRTAKELLMSCFKDKKSFSEDVAVLSEELDKKTHKAHKFGKVLLSLSSDEPQDCQKLTIERSHFKFKQHLSIDLIKQDFSVYTVWYSDSEQHKAPSKIEFIRAKRCSEFKENFENVNNSIEFDAGILKNCFDTGIRPKHYNKVLDCSERNHLRFEKFVSKINQRSITDLFLPNLINKARIKTNGKDTTFFEFVSRFRQQINIKVTKNISCITVNSLS